MKEHDDHKSWIKVIETREFRYKNLNLFDPEYELLVEEYLEELDEQGV